MTVKQNDLVKIRQLGLDALSRELGPVAMIRFLQEYEAGRGDYTQERHQWVDKMSVADIGKQTGDYSDIAEK